MTEYAKENIAKVYIYLRDPFVKQMKREEKTSYVQLIGTIGGLLGLFMGFSFISVIETFYMIFLWMIGKLNKGLAEAKLWAKPRT